MSDTPIMSIRELAEFVRSHQYAIEGNSQMEDVLATIARALHEICDLLVERHP